MKKKQGFTEEEKDGFGGLGCFLVVALIFVVLIVMAIIVPEVTMVILSIVLGVIVGGLVLAAFDVHVGLLIIWGHRRRLWLKFRSQDDYFDDELEG